MQARMLIQTENDRVFAAAVAFTRERSPASFDQWFSGVQFDGLTDGVLALRARDEFVREWVDDHFLPTLNDFIRAQTGWSIQVAWVVDSALVGGQALVGPGRAVSWPAPVFGPLRHVTLALPLRDDVVEAGGIGFARHAALLSLRR